MKDIKTTPIKPERLMWLFANSLVLSKELGKVVHRSMRKMDDQI
jgi:hypothetical protein